MRKAETTNEIRALAQDELRSVRSPMFALADAELDQVSGGLIPWPYMPLVLFALTHRETGTLKAL